jgi:hypothetical protein
MARLRSSSLFVTLIALYLLAIAASPALHCDFDCHAKTPSHCQACLASAPAPPPIAALSVWSGSLPFAGDAPAVHVVPQPRAIQVDLPGRAPPA